MDQVRVALEWLKRQHFWVLSVLVALIAIVCWAKASSKMEASFKANKGTIDTEFKAVSSIRSEPFHPNDDVNKKQAGQTKEQAKLVADLWDTLYKRQSKGVLTWPKSLGPRFAETIEKLQFGAPIPEDLRNVYRDYVDRYFPELPKIVDARVMEANETVNGPGSYGRGPGAGPEGPGRQSASTETSDDNDYICEWLDQGTVRENLYFRERPNSIKIWITQENLWVYKALLEIIAKTNQAAGATRMSNAAVRTIRELQVGRDAGIHSRTPGRLMIQPPTQQAGGPGPGGAGPEGAAGPERAGPGAPGGMPGAPGGPESMMPGGPGGAGQAMTEDQERAYLLSNRYLDPQGKPIPSGGAPSGDTSASPPTDTAAAPAPDLSAFGVEYKRVPVRMVLRMDQRWLQQLIAFCASQSLQVEVQEVRVNVADALGQSGGGPSGNFRGGPSGGAGPAEPERSPTFPQNPELADVIIQGTIYIFNKPNASVLDTGGEQQPLANANTAQ